MRRPLRRQAGGLAGRSTPPLCGLLADTSVESPEKKLSQLTHPPTNHREEAVAKASSGLNPLADAAATPSCEPAARATFTISSSKMLNRRYEALASGSSALLELFGGPSGYAET